MATATITSLTTLVRYILQDFSRTEIDYFTYSTSSVFTLSEPNVNSVTTVLVDDVELGSGDWSFDSTTNKVTISASMSAGDSVEIRYTCYANYSDTEIEAYIRSAVVQLSINQYYTWEIVADGTLYPEPDDDEENLIAVVASVIAEPNNESIRTPDFSIQVPTSLPTREIISKVIGRFKTSGFHGIIDVI